MIYRPHWGSLAESMEHAVVINPPTLEGLAAYLRARVEDVEVKPYCDLPDDRIGWEQTYLVVYKGWACGFTNGVTLETL